MALDGNQDFARTFFVPHPLIVGLPKRKEGGAEDVRRKVRIGLLKKYGRTFITAITNPIIQTSSVINSVLRQENNSKG